MEPQRFILKGEQVSEGFAAAGCTPPASQFYSALPQAGGKLPDLLKDESGSLDPAARAIFEALASPRVMLRFVNLAAGSSIAIETRLVGDGVGRFVVLARPDGQYWDLALLPDRASALALLDGLVGASGLEDMTEGFTLDISLSGLAVITAMAQLARLSELRAELGDAEAVFDFLTAPIPVQYVVAAIDAQRDSPEPGSPLGILALASDGALLDALERATMGDALAELEASGFIDEDGVLTGDGLALMALIKSRETISVLQGARRRGNDIGAESLVLLHGKASLLTGTWRLGDDARPVGLTLAAMAGPQLLDLLDAMLQAPEDEADDAPALDDPVTPANAAAPGGFCPECGAGHDDGQKFCRSCGTKL